MIYVLKGDKKRADAKVGSLGFVITEILSTRYRGRR